MSLMRVMTEVTGGPGRGILRVRKFTPRAPHPRGASAVPQSSARTSGTRRGKGLTRMNGSTTVSAELSLWLGGPEHTPVPLVASRRYRGDAPDAARVAVPVGTGEPAAGSLATGLAAGPESTA